MSFEDFIDEEDIEFVNELENPPKYHYEEHSEDIIHIYADGEVLDCDEIVDLLNKQDAKIKELQQLVEDMSNYIEKLGGWED